MEKSSPESQKPIDIKDGAEDLYKKISESTVGILQGEVFKEGLKVLNEKLDPEAVEKLVGMIAVAMTASAYNAVAQYHASVINTLIKQSEDMNTAFGNVAADIHGMNSAIQILRGRITELEKKSLG